MTSVAAVAIRNFTQIGSDLDLFDNCKIAAHALLAFCLHELAQTMYFLARVLESDGDGFAREYEPRSG